MTLTEKLATEIAQNIKTQSQNGILIPKTAEEIFKNQDAWFPQFDQQGNLTGFFEYRTHKGTNDAEMGSVMSLKKGTGTILLQVFNTQRKLQKSGLGFAITKDFETAQKFFAAQTKGKILKPHDFPDWFHRVKDDRFMIQWK